jgi:hypothetical protein
MIGDGASKLALTGRASFALFAKASFGAPSEEGIIIKNDHGSLLEA